MCIGNNTLVNVFHASDTAQHAPPSTTAQQCMTDVHPRRHMGQVVAEHGGAVSNAGRLPDDELATACTRLDGLADPDTRTVSAEAVRVRAR